MAKRIRIRKGLMVAAVAGALTVAIAAPAVASVPTDNGSSATRCLASPRMLHNEPDMCSQVVFTQGTAEVESARPAPATSSGSSPAWTLLPVLAILALAAGVAAIRIHPHAVS